MSNDAFSLEGKRGLVMGVANDHSIAYGCAKAFHECGATLALTYGHAGTEAYVRPLAQRLACPIFMQCDLAKPGDLDAVFARIAQEWGRLDFALHAVAFAPKEDLHRSLVECSQEGFALAMNLSCHSFIRMVRLAAPLMMDGGSLLTLSYYGADKAVEHYNVMGPVKAALESSVRYMAADLGPKKIRVNAISPGPIRTRAASGIDHFDALMETAASRSPEHQLVTIEDVGNLAAFLVSEGAKGITGNTAYVDAGFHAVA